MSFTTRPGTRGARQPTANWLVNLVNGQVMRRIRHKHGRAMGMNTLVLNTVGAKSGARRSTPVAWFDGGEGTWLVVASAGGATGNPAWYYNLAAHPDRVEIEVGGETIPVTAEQLHGTARDQAWAAITAAAPRFNGYQTKTDRELPIIRLRRQT